MEYGFLSRAGKFLQEQKKHRRWMMVFLCLAGGVILGTLGYLKLYGQAMTHKMKVLECQYEVHEHTDECYEEEEDGTKVLVCGYADYVIHVHNDDCYNKKGELVCTLEEHELHEHSEECYGEEEILICTEPETEVSGEPEASEEHPAAGEISQEAEQPVQPDETAQTEEPVQICKMEEHMHGEECYAESQSCGLNEHTHGDSCYTEMQTCGLDEHIHDDGCYTETQTCGLDEHTHDDGCYNEDGELVCGQEEHTHDDGCMSTELTCGQEEHTHDESCISKELTCTEKEHIHTDACRSGELVCALEEHTHTDGCYEQQGTETASQAEAEEAEPVTEEPVREAPESEEPEEAEEGHVHTEECYEAEEGLICGEQELHIHDESCYAEDCFDEDGNLIEGSRVSCGLLQLEEHVHTEECFRIVELTPEEVAALNGGAALHVHSEDCYDEEGNLICGHVVTHLHGLDCYDEDGHLICGFGEGSAHEHGENCYDEEGNLICGFEDAKDHEHDAGCYDGEGNLTCGYEGMKDHEHDAGCYDGEGNLTCGYEGMKDHEHDAGCYDGEGNLICGYEGAKNHEHSEACYDGEGNLICGYEGVRVHEHDARCYDIYGELICGYEGAADHVHTEDCYDEEGNLICGYEVRVIYEQSKIFECADYVVVARYNNDAGIPEEAEFLAEQITPDMDEEHYVNRETEYKEMLGDEDASMKALLKIGFYVEEDGGEKEIEPKTPVAIAVQFLDEDGLAENSPITIIHFAEGGTEKLDGSDAKDNSTTFTMESFSEIAIGQSEKKMERQAGQPLQLSDDFEYVASPFLITFHVEGTPTDPEGNPVIVGAAGPAVPEGESDGTEGGEPTADGAEESDAGLPEDGTAGETEDIVSEEDTNGDGTDISGEDETAEAEGDTDTETESGTTPDTAEGEAGTDTGVISQEPKLIFSVNSMEDDGEIREALAKYLGEPDGTVTQRVLHALSYTLTYGETELKLDNCTVTAEIAFGTASSDNGADASSEKDENVSAGEDVSDEGAADGDAAGDAPVPDEEMTADESSDEEKAEPDTGSGSGDADGQSDNAAAEDAAGGDEAPEGETGNVGAEGMVAAYMASADMGDTGISGTDVSIMVLEISEDRQVKKLDTIVLDEGDQNKKKVVHLKSNLMVLSERSVISPEFTVQYYAYVDVAARDKDFTDQGDLKGIEIIDTSKEANGEKPVLPTNSAQPELTKLIIENTNKKGLIGPIYQVKSGESLEKIYKDESYKFLDAPELENFNKYATEYTNYNLIEVWVLNEGGDPESKDNEKNDWKVFPYSESLEFTNDPKSANEKPDSRILIKDNTVIRLVSESNSGEATYPALFYDYDITNGEVYSDPACTVTGDRNSSGALYARTYQQGINNPDNYKDADGNIPQGPSLAFGNNNTGGTGFEGDTTSDGYYINRATINPKMAYGNCSFGIVQKKLGSDGYPVFNMNAPDLFGSKVQVGKTGVENYALNFNRRGDTYTLTSVNNGKTNNLEMFEGMSNWNKTRYIWTNSFWPMDTSDTFGANGHDLKFGIESLQSQRNAVGKTGTTFPVSDDKVNDHNSYFGMSFAVDFELTEDYLGPLNYYFFGDDDMWVFLDDMLVCDIGGVHSSAGEYVDLWDYIEKGTPGKYRLKFFYTERGASGSTCWMQFTLPSVNVVPVEYPSGKCKNTLTISKGVSGTVTDDKFEFEITFFDKSGTKELINSYDYRIMNDGSENPVESGAIRTGGKFYLGNGQSIIIGSLPDGTRYTIKETEYSGYESEINNTIVADGTVTGSIDWTRDDVESYINKALPYELPETGGSGAIWYMMAGAFLLSLGVGLIYSKKFSERRV